ncbi:hypothetical protein [Ancylobacter polymorphus]|uniref:Uncharacterized protein n=1 Tax=Ancylobacter polymorphus TaxID=223390 RepID=A0A9E6ZWZ3_9HYPH|nr:hypothetical protein [Ancylobacter polymorphus]UOK71537.1 hypothetical protein K9D25_02085 [Ancylobacter polymorphus]
MAPALVDMGNEDAGDVERQRRIAPFERQVDVLSAPEGERPPIGRGDQTGVHGRGEHEIGGEDRIDDIGQCLFRRRDRGAHHHIAARGGAKSLIVARVMEMRDAKGFSAQRLQLSRAVKRGKEKRRVALRHIGAKLEFGGAQRPSYGANLGRWPVCLRQTTGFAHAASPEHDRAFPGGVRRDEDVVDHAADDVDAGRAGPMVEEEVRYQVFRNIIAEILRIFAEKPITDARFIGRHCAK